MFGICDATRIMPLDGTHRLTALTLVNMHHIPIKTSLTIALASFDKEQQPLFNRLFE